MDGTACQRDGRGGGDEDTGRTRPRARRSGIGTSETLTGGLGRGGDLVRDRILVELASDITADYFLSLTKWASLGSYEFFRSLLRVPLFMVSDTLTTHQYNLSSVFAWYYILT